MQAVETAARIPGDRLRAVRGTVGHKLLPVNVHYRKSIQWLLAASPSLLPLDFIEDLSAGTIPDLLQRIVARARSLGIDVYASEITPPDVASASSLEVWRVVCPQAHPFSLWPVRYPESARAKKRMASRIGAGTEEDTAVMPHFCP
jgi:hypothetical protein